MHRLVCGQLSCHNMAFQMRWLLTHQFRKFKLLGPCILFQQRSPITVEELREKLCLKRLHCICLANLNRVFGEKHSTFPSICWYLNTYISTVSKHLQLGKDPKNKKVKVNQTCSSTQIHIKKKKRQKSLSKYDRWPNPTKQVAACHQL